MLYRNFWTFKNSQRQKISDINIFGPTPKFFMAEIFGFNLAFTEPIFGAPLRSIFN